MKISQFFFPHEKKFDILFRFFIRIPGLPDAFSRSDRVYGF